MSEFRYILTILSSGRPVYLERTLASYAQHLSPAPSAVYAYDDGETTPLAALYLPAAQEAWGGADWRSESSPVRLGQCAAQARCWQAASASEFEWAFHIEDDSVLLRPTDLRDLAAVLDAEPTLAQMALVRCPWGHEIEYGGYISQTPGHYERRETIIESGAQGCYRHLEWISTVRNWAHAPALFRTSLTREFPFPAEAGCETTIGPMIRARYPDAVFGLWGAGEPWSAHIGVERAPGSHGY